ncbi:MAG: hypothetical protein VZR00_09825 [Lachnospiraceae bacterium]|nr:hypothetical protein [Lachnospiraceae bacterium]MEE3462161.1 hypothetical protein [Lachnospiraceae bacterium]
MGDFFIDLARVQRVSKEYLEAEPEAIAKQNREVLGTISVLYTLILICYNIIVPLKFSHWNITPVYRTALVIQIFVAVYIFLRHFNKERSFREVQITCSCL